MKSPHRLFLLALLASCPAGAASPEQEKGAAQARRLWTAADGSPEDFQKFAAENFAQGAERDLIFARFEAKLEALRGHFTAMGLELRREQDEDRGELRPVDRLFAAFAPDAHLADDLFQSRLGFVAALNFPFPTLEETLRDGPSWDRRRWAEARLAKVFAFRVPGEVRQKTAEIRAAAEAYVYAYDIHMDHVAGPDGQPLFPAGLKLISHWGLRDHIRALYADPKGLALQKLILTIMERIIAQEIPRSAVGGRAQLWDPARNTLGGAPAEREPDTRYEVLLSLFRAARLEDPFYPGYPTLMDRSFRLEREMTEPEG
ncbi:MAG: hypothetical protein PHU21_13105, partial [Elusimicrobia bacterium]|nr:hypothetical protein [Elusimicrobiota bacterium]